MEITRKFYHEDDYIDPANEIIFSKLRKGKNIQIFIIYDPTTLVDGESDIDINVAINGQNIRHCIIQVCPAQNTCGINELESVQMLCMLKNFVTLNEFIEILKEIKRFLRKFAAFYTITTVHSYKWKRYKISKEHIWLEKGLSAVCSFKHKKPRINPNSNNYITLYIL